MNFWWRKLSQVLNVATLYVIFMAQIMDIVIHSDYKIQSK